MARLTKTTYKGVCFIDGEETHLLKGHRVCIEHHDAKKCPHCKAKKSPVRSLKPKERRKPKAKMRKLTL